MLECNYSARVAEPECLAETETRETDVSFNHCCDCFNSILFGTPCFNNCQNVILYPLLTLN